MTAQRVKGLSGYYDLVNNRTIVVFHGVECDLEGIADLPTGSIDKDVQQILVNFDCDIRDRHVNLSPL